jgi:hypothetical protein
VSRGGDNPPRTPLQRPALGLDREPGDHGAHRGHDRELREDEGQASARADDRADGDRADDDAEPVPQAAERRTLGPVGGRVQLRRVQVEPRVDRVQEEGRARGEDGDLTARRGAGQCEHPEGQHAAAERGHQRRPAAHPVDDHGDDEGAEQSCDVAEQRVDQRGGQIEAEVLGIEGRQPGGDAVVDVVRHEPQAGQDRRAAQVAALEDVAEPAPAGVLPDVRGGQRQRFRGGAGDLRLDPGHGGLGLLRATAGQQPARGFLDVSGQRGGDEHGQGADDEHGAPAEVGHHPDGDQGGRGETGREDHLVQQHEAAALVGAGDLVDVRGRHGHHTADAESLGEPEQRERLDAAGEGDGEACEPGDADPEGHRAHTADPVAQPSGADGADEHADGRGGHGEGGLPGGEVPFLHQDGQGRGCQQLVERLEEGDGADQEPDLDVPARVRQSFESRGYGAKGWLAGHSRHGGSFREPEELRRQ